MKIAIFSFSIFEVNVWSLKCHVSGITSVKGDLYISGAGLSKGYWEDPEKTAKAFLPRPSSVPIYRTGDIAYVDDDGMFCFVGRNDSQIKSRGYRIELGEIEFNQIEFEEIELKEIELKEI